MYTTSVLAYNIKLVYFHGNVSCYRRVMNSLHQNCWEVPELVQMGWNPKQIQSRWPRTLKRAIYPVRGMEVLTSCASCRCIVEWCQVVSNFRRQSRKATAMTFHATQSLCFGYYFKTPKVTLLGLRNRVSWQNVSSASTKMPGLIKLVCDGGSETSLYGLCCHLSGCCSKVWVKPCCVHVVYYFRFHYSSRGKCTCFRVWYSHRQVW